ncbi:unnamed protein product [Diamesa serratosioi]
MNVLSPELMWIQSRCYRVNIPSLENADRHSEAVKKINYCEDDPEDFQECVMEADEDGFNVEVLENGRKFQLKVHVPQIFHAQLIGAKGMTRRRLEQETSTLITIPKIGVPDTMIKVKGNERRHVLTAKRRIDLIVMAGRSKQIFTHFIAIPFTNDEIQKNFAKFKGDILNDKDIHGMDESLFQNPMKLHLTISTLVLMDNEDRANAAGYLQECQEIIKDMLKGEELKVKLSGIEYMNDDPSSVDVLYGKVESTLLQEVADAVSNYFSDKGLFQKKSEHVKLHVTLINSLFRDNDDACQESEVNQQGSKHQRTSFDATKILSKFKDFNFGNLTITEIHVSTRYSKGSNGFYEATGIIKI